MFKTINTYTSGGALVKRIIEPTAYYLYPRSSIYKTSYRQANSVGIIDSGYRGNLMAAMDYYPHKDHTPLSKGKRYWQICAPDLKPIDKVVLVDKLDNTVRGTGGLGSTGN
jgi:dUTP pyrophosphatase